MKKKLIKTLSLAFVFFLSTSVTFAESNVTYNNVDEEKVIPVYADITKENGNDDGNNYYYIVLSWETSNASYVSASDVYKWDAENMKYVKIESGESDNLTSGADATSEITITNQSNDSIDYSISYTTVEGINSTETAQEGFETLMSGEISSAISNDYVLPNTSLDEYYDETKMSAVSIKYKGNIKLEQYALSSENLVIGNYTVTISKNS